VGTPDDGGRLPPRDLTGEQICTERDFREREGSAGRRATDDGRRKHWTTDDRSAGRRTTEAPDDGAGDVTDRRQISELGGLGSVGITGRRTTEAPDDGRRKRRKTDDGAGDVTDRRQISELGGLGSVGITGRRTADDGCAGRRTTHDGRRTTDDGFSRSVRREISERERERSSGEI
jgi:hypothetical protein